MNAAAAELRMRFQFVDMESFADLEPTLKLLLSKGVDGVEAGVFPNDEEVAAIFVRYKLPSLGVPSAGSQLDLAYPKGLFSRTAARYIDMIFKGSKPAELPVEQHAPELTINLKTAKALGLSIPRSLLLRADKVLPL